jgi:UDP-glucose 4-epimerase
VTVLDDFSTGYRDALTDVDLVEGSLGDAAVLDSVFSNQTIDAVMHFAAYIEVGESVREPGKYYANNFAQTQVLLEAMRRHAVSSFIFSSTAAVYGMPHQVPIAEDHPLSPINPYGRSKLAVEWMLQDYATAHGLRYATLRYFNAAGADPAGRLGERHEPESHLIPLVLQAASGRRDAITVFGRDYDTPDGTCIRDYVHVVDLCAAHELALQGLLDGGPGGVYNLGNGQGFSVQEVIETVKRVTGLEFVVSDGERRAGDPARLVADSRRAMQELGWRPAYADLTTMVEHAWAWEQRPRG